MTLSTATTDGMKYEAMRGKKISNRKTVALESAAGASTGSLIWLLIKRHKLGLVVTYALIISVLYFVPFVPDLLFSLIGR